MDYLQKKFKKTQQAVLTEKEYKYASMRAIFNETVKEGDQRQLKELVEEINGHLTDLRVLLGEKDLKTKEWAQELIQKFEDCLVRILNKDDRPEPEDKIEPKVQVKVENKVEFSELEHKLKLMRQKRLNRLSTFVNEQTKLSEMRNELAKVEDDAIALKTDVETNSSVQTCRILNEKTEETVRRVADIRSSFGKSSVNMDPPKTNAKKFAETPKIQLKPNPIALKSPNSPRTPTQMRKLFNSLSSCVVERKLASSPENAVLREIDQIQLTKINKSEESNEMDLIQEHRKSPRRPIAVAPPRINYPQKPDNQIDVEPIDREIMTKSFEEPKNKDSLKRVSSGPSALSLPMADLDPLDFVIMSVKRNKPEESFESTERSSFTTFRSSKDSLRDNTSTKPDFDNLDNNDRLKLNEENNIEKSLVNLLTRLDSLHNLLKNKLREDLSKLSEYQPIVENINKSLETIKEGIEQKFEVKLGTSDFEDISKLEKSVRSFRGLRRDLGYLVLTSSLEKIRYDLTQESDKDEVAKAEIVERIQIAESDLEERVDENEKTLRMILKTQIVMGCGFSSPSANATPTESPMTEQCIVTVFQRYHTTIPEEPETPSSPQKKVSFAAEAEQITQEENEEGDGGNEEPEAGEKQGEDSQRSSIIHPYEDSDDSSDLKKNDKVE